MPYLKTPREDSDEEMGVGEPVSKGGESERRGA
jgi:hypothetical protein